MTEERIKILEMVANGVISAKEANELLATLDNNKVEHEGKFISESKLIKETAPKNLHIKVLSADGDKVNITFPIALVKALVKSGGIKGMITSSLKGVNEDVKSTIDLDMIAEFIDNGVIGNIVDIESADGDKVNIYID